MDYGIYILCYVSISSMEMHSVMDIFQNFDCTLDNFVIWNQSENMEKC